MNKTESIDQIFEDSGLKMSIYKHLENVDLDLVYHFCKSDHFKVIITDYISSEENSRIKEATITSFVSQICNSDFNLELTIRSIEYLSLDLDFIYFAFPYFKDFLPIREVHELHYIFKRVVCKKIVKVNTNYLETLFFHTGYNSDDEFSGCTNNEIEKLNIESLIYADKCLAYCLERKSLIFTYDWKGRLNAPQNIVSILKFVSNKLLSNKIFFKKLINQDYYLVRYITSKLVNNKSIFNHARMIFLEEHPNNNMWEFNEFIEFHPLQYFSLKNERQTVLSCIIDSSEIFKIIDEKFRDDVEVVLASVSSDGNALKYASKRLQDDKIVVLAAVSNDGLALEYASERLQDDKIIVLNAVSNHGRSLKYASERLTDDEDVIIASMKSDREGLQFSSSRFKVKYMHDSSKDDLPF